MLRYRNEILCCSSNLLLITFYFFQKYSVKNNIECYLASLTIISYGFAILFYKNPKKGSNRKKISILSFFLILNETTNL